MGHGAFSGCTGLTTVLIPNSVSSIGDYAFFKCAGLTAVYFEGDAPGVEVLGQDEGAALQETPATTYYLPGASGWTETFSGRPTAVWRPKVQTSDGSFGIRTNQFGFTINWASGRTVFVEACADLASPTWSAVSTNTLVNGSASFSDPDLANHPRRFYRVQGE